MNFSPLRIGAAVCLGVASLLHSFEPPLAAGRQVPDTDARYVAQANDSAVRLVVTAACEGNFALFTVVNEGEIWPEMSKVTVYRVQGKVLVSQRAIRMAQGQRMSFKVRSTPGSPTEFGIFIEPAWYTRGFAYDAKITC